MQNESSNREFLAMLADLETIGDMKAMFRAGFTDDQLLDLWRKLGGSFDLVKNSTRAQKLYMSDAGTTVDQIVKFLQSGK